MFFYRILFHTNKLIHLCSRTNQLFYVNKYAHFVIPSICEEKTKIRFCDTNDCLYTIQPHTFPNRRWFT